MRIHVLGLHHTICDDRWSTCAFTGKVRRLPSVLNMAFPETPVAVYGNGNSTADFGDAECAFVELRTERDLIERFGPDVASNPGRHAADVRSIWDFEIQLGDHLRDRLRRGDLILHPFGQVHKGLVQRFPEAIHIESGIGYVSGPFGAYRIFESEAWRNWHFGRHHTDMRCAGDGGPNTYDNTHVVPNYYDPEDWPLGRGRRGDVVFAGRMVGEKGLGIVAELARRMPDVPFRVAGEGPHGAMFFGDLPNVTQVGVVTGRARAELYGEAACVVMPTRYVEPFGGVGVEAMLCGTPVLASEHGCFRETVGACACGALCRTVDDFEREVRNAVCGRALRNSHRQAVREYAISRFSFDAVAPQYAAAFEAVRADWMRG